MALRVAVCDDSAADRDYVAGLAHRWAGERGYALELFTFLSAENFLFEYSENKNVDILLLDIEMGEMDGVTLAKELRRENETVQIVFITGYDDYIAEGYDVSALHYLMKPVDEAKLWAVLDKAVSRLSKAERALTLDMSGETVRLPLSRIRYVDVRLNYVTVHADRDYTVKKPLSEIAPMLDDRFHRVGRSAIVNLTCIDRVTRTEILLRDGATVPLPRGAWEGVNRAIINME